MLSDIDAMLQSLYVLNNTPVSDARGAPMDGNADDYFVEYRPNRETSTTPHVANPVATDALPFQVTVKSHEICLSKDWKDKEKRGVGVVLSASVENTTGGVPKYSYIIPAGRLIQTYFKKKQSIAAFHVRVTYVENKYGGDVESENHNIEIKDEETETPYPVSIENPSSHVEGWNIYKDNRLVLQIRFHSVCP